MCFIAGILVIDFRIFYDEDRTMFVLCSLVAQGDADEAGAGAYLDPFHLRYDSSPSFQPRLINDFVSICIK